MKDKGLTDYNFFYSNKDLYNFTNSFVNKPKYSPSSPSAKSAFINYLKTGSYPKSSSEPEELLELLVARKTILEYIEKAARRGDFSEQPISYFLNNFIDPPKWVLNRFIKESSRRT